MNASAPGQQSAAKPVKPRSELRETLTFLVKLILLVAIVRSFFFAPFSIPSGSMLPRLLIGDYLFITKWNYGYSRYSLPFSVPLIPDRIFAKDPERGDVVVFKAPPDAQTDWIKRVIGVPGDTVQMRNGQLILNGQEIPKERVGNFVLPISPNSDCDAEFIETDATGKAICSIPQYRETLPGGKSYMVLDHGMTIGDDTEVFTVPAGHVFMMGDNRDNSSDSRFEPVFDSLGINRGGIRFVPMENIQGKAIVNFWSTDGSANWVLPWTWFSAARFERIGDGF